MKRILFLALVVVGAVFSLNSAETSGGGGQTLRQPAAAAAAADCQCVTDALADIGKIKVGMKRKDLDKMFSADGGISAINPERFVYDKCRFIKVEVKFEFTDKGGKFPKGSPADEIVAISRPYLEHPFYD
jgi:hypothetical protein